MKLRVIDRLLIALCGLILLALAVWMALDATGVVMPVSEALAWLLNVGAMKTVWLVAALCAVLALLGIYEISLLFRRRKGKRGFVTQRSENGEIAISVKSIESLVTRCAQKHGEITVQSVAVEEARDGLIIRLRAMLASGMNIPLAVGTLQKQIKQYITACTGVDVREVRVKVDSTDKAAENSPYAVSDDSAALPVEQPEPAPMPAEAVAPVEIPAEEPVPEEHEERLTHQRLFSTVEEPNLVPEPPVIEKPAVSEAEIMPDVEQEMADDAGEIEAEVEEPITEELAETQETERYDAAEQAETDDESDEPEELETEKTTEE
ncbi:MAG: alkaline shock response membrane anchor protein AmaP [Christensenellaceae bacterium]|nr:alkaline shock response membrane anchor protein AmaP [Christensenellaceae bacterium]